VTESPGDEPRDVPPFGDLMNEIPLFRELQRVLFSSTGPVNWELARQVAIAGGLDLLGRPLVPSIDVPWEDFVAADPEFLFLLPCGFDAERAVSEAGVLVARPEWQRLRAVRNGTAYVLDGNAYFSRPGPRVVDGIELLASLLHPGHVTAPPGARVLTPPDSSSVA